MEFIKPNTNFLDEYLSACKESLDNHITEWMPVEEADFEAWKRRALSVYRMLESGVGLPAGIPRMETYWCIDGSQFIGEIQIRPFLTAEEAKAVGHIGYAVRYSMWNKGFGTKLLRYAVDKLRDRGVFPIYIACHGDNIGSNKVSQKVGFEFMEARDSDGRTENLYIFR